MTIAIHRPDAGNTPRDMADGARAAAADPDRYWREQGRALDSIVPCTQVKPMSFDRDDVHIRWFADVPKDHGATRGGRGDGRMPLEENVVYPGESVTGDGARRNADTDHRTNGLVDGVIDMSGHRTGTAEVEPAPVGHARAPVAGLLVRDRVG